MAEINREEWLAKGVEAWEGGARTQEELERALSDMGLATGFLEQIAQAALEEAKKKHPEGAPLPGQTASEVIRQELTDPFDPKGTGSAEPQSPPLAP